MLRVNNPCYECGFDGKVDLEVWGGGNGVVEEGSREEAW